MDIFLNAIWLIPLYPLAAFLAIVFGLNRHKQVSAWTAIGAMAAATFHSWAVVVNVVAEYNTVLGQTTADHHGDDAHGGGHHVLHGIFVDGWGFQFDWLPTGDSVFQMGFAVDGLTAAMLFMVPFVCMLIFIYASEYMEGYEAEFGRYARFFAYVSLFAAGMLLLVIADNLLLLFIAWEIMGLCSYLLIGFWFEKTYPDTAKLDQPKGWQQLLQFWKYPGPDKIPPKLAGLKAFITTRVGDVLLFAGMLLLWSYAGTLTFREVFVPEMLAHLNEATVWGVPVSVLASLLILGGAVGKSAQFPLHVWLPDAMEGPTPVSALIHAATMVSAGVYLVARMLPLLATFEAGLVMNTLAILGAITAVGGATIGLTQYDIKRVLAYSTISQLGYMMMALGIGAYLAAVFHLLTHAFFKALLFMGSGSVIHAMEHGAHHVHDHHTDPQDMRNMGGLMDKMFPTFIAYIAGTLALVGIFPFAGFWSKDEILVEAFQFYSWTSVFVFVMGVIGAILTAFYMGRQIGMVFLGKPRTKIAAHAVEPGSRMTTPLLVLAFFATFLGFINVPADFPIIGHGWFHGFAGEVHLFAEEAVPGIHFSAPPFSWLVAIESTVLAIGFFGLGIYLYSQLTDAKAKDPLQKIPNVGEGMFALFYNKYYIDELYRALFIYPTLAAATWCARFDYEWVINPIVNAFGRATRLLADISAAFDRAGIDETLVEGIPQLVSRVGERVRFVQTGRAQDYLRFTVAGLIILVIIALFFAAGAATALSVMMP